MGLMNMQIGMKRSRDISDHQFDSVTAMANCLMLLSGGGGAGGEQLDVLRSFASQQHHRISVNPSRVFECKTCNRQFSSFQALGGHRASHKKPKLGGDLSLQSRAEASPAKPKTHECSICGQEFAVGQALGGHMRRHRSASAAVSGEISPAVAGKITAGGSKRVWGLDLNLTPFENDGLEFGLGKTVTISPAVPDDGVL